jgi:hypothetical protein
MGENLFPISTVLRKCKSRLRENKLLAQKMQICPILKKLDTLIIGIAALISYFIIAFMVAFLVASVMEVIA